MTETPTPIVSAISRRRFLAGAASLGLAGCNSPSQSEARLAQLKALNITPPALTYIASADCVADSPHNVEHLTMIAAKTSLPVFQIDITPIVRKNIDGTLSGGLSTPQKVPYPGQYRYISNPAAAYNEDTIDKARSLGFSAVNSASHSGNILLINAKGDILVARSSKEPVLETITQIELALSAEQARSGKGR